MAIGYFFQIGETEVFFIRGIGADVLENVGAWLTEFVPKESLSFFPPPESELGIKLRAAGELNLKRQKEILAFYDKHKE